MTIASRRILFAACIGKMDDAKFMTALQAVSETTGLVVPSSIDSDCRLRDYVQDILAPSNNVKPGQVKSYFIVAVNCLRSFLGRDPAVRELTIGSLIGFNEWMRDKAGIKTCRYRMSALTYIWRSACNAEIIPWFDGDSSRELKELIRFTGEAQRQGAMRRFVDSMRSIVHKEPKPCDLTPGVVSQVIDQLKITADGAKDHHKTSTILKMAHILAKLAGVDLVMPIPKANVSEPIPIERQATANQLPDDGSNPALSNTLDSALDEIILEKEMTNKTIWMYRKAISLFGEYFGHQALVKDLTVNNVNRWMVFMQSIGKSGMTVKNYRTGICRIWNYLAETDRVPGYDPKRLRKPNIICKPVLAFEREEVAILLRAAKTTKGRLKCGIPACDLMAFWILAGYDSGLRPCDIFRLQFDDIDRKNGNVSIVQNKTGNPHRARLSVDTLRALEVIAEPERRLVIPVNTWAVRRYARKLFKVAESLGFKKRRGQGLSTLRKTHATQVYKQYGLAAAAESLGHAGGTRTAQKHYVDHRAVDQGRLPPSLEGGAA